MKDVGSRAIEMKVVMVGDIGVGKTSVAARFIRNQFKENGQSTIGASYMWKECLVKDQKLKFAVWDTAGQEQYHSLVPMYFRSAAAVVLVFDVTNPKTLESAITWEEQIRTNAPANVIVALVGNKCDLSERAVSEEDIENVKEKSKADLAFECSAKTSQGIFEIFEAIALLHLERNDLFETRERTGTFVPGVTPPPPPKPKCRC